MSLVHLWHSCFGGWVLSLVALDQYCRSWRCASGVDQAHLMQRQIRHSADNLSDVMGIWHIEDSLEIKAHIAYWHRSVHTYRGYVLCSDRVGRTVLLDTQSWTYVMLTTISLLQIDGVEQAKRFIDDICRSLQAD